MKKPSLCLWILGFSAAAVLFHEAALYWLGYSQSKPALVASDTLGFFCVELFLFAALVILVVAFLCRRIAHRFWMLAAAFCFWPMIFLLFIVIEGDGGICGNPIMSGLRDRLNHDYTWDELHDLAVTLKNSGADRYDSDTTYNQLHPSTEQQKMLLVQLGQKYPFLFQAPDIYYDDQIQAACFRWGDAEYWGVAIYVAGSVYDRNYYYGTPTNPESELFLNKDVEVFFRNGDLD